MLVRNRKGDLFLQKLVHPPFGGQARPPFGGQASTKRVQPGKWDSSVGGHLLPGETFEAAASARLRIPSIDEELGIRADHLEHLHDYVWRSDVETEHIRTFVPPGRGVLTPNLEEELRRTGILKPEH